MANDAESKLDKINQAMIVVFIIAMVFCSMEVVPGWGLFNLDWPPSAFYAIMAVCGALVGVTVKQHKLIGIISGILAGIGCIFVCQFTLERVNWIPGKLLALIGLVGTLPGVGFYFLVEQIFLSKSMSKVNALLDRLKPVMPEKLYQSCVTLNADGETTMLLETIVEAIGERIPADKVPYAELLDLAKANHLKEDDLAVLRDGLEKYPEPN